MALTQLTKIDGGGISTTSDYRVGVITATKFIGPFEGSTATFSGNINAVDGTFSGNVTIGGTLTYEDVTNIDSVGIITARDGLKVLAGGANVVGVVTATTFKGDGDFVDIDVDGHTNLDNVSIAGVTTITDDVVTTKNLLTLKGTSWGDEEKVYTTYKRGAVDLGRVGVEADGSGTAGQMIFEVATSSSPVEAMRINSSRKVGIGTNNPVRNLHLHEPSTGNAYLHLTNNSTGATTEDGFSLYVQSDGSTWYRARESTGRHIWTTAGDEKMRLTADGDVLIGHTSVVNNARLTIGQSAAGFTTSIALHNPGGEGTKIVSTRSLVLGADYDNNTGVSGSLIAFETNGTEKLRITSAGLVGINTNDPASPLHIEQSTDNAVTAGITLKNNPSIGAQRFTLYNEENVGTHYNSNDGGTARAHIFETGGDEKLRIKSNGFVGIGTDNPTRFLHVQDGSNTLLALDSTDTNADLVQSDTGGSTLIRSSSGALDFFTGGDASSTNATNSGKRITIDTSGHIIPGAAGTQDLGSTTKEFNNLYLGDSGKAFFGLDQDFSIWHNNSHGLIKNTTGRLYLLSDDLWIKNEADNKTSARFMDAGEVFLYNNDTLRLTTTTTGITVGGEVAASQDYPNIRPRLDLNFVAVKKLDSRITYTREGPASYVDKNGLIKTVGYNTPRFDHDPITGESKGLLMEQSRYNMFAGTAKMGSEHGVWIIGGSRGKRGPNVKGPDGKLSALNNIYNGTNGDLNIYYAPRNGANEMTVSNDTIYTCSIFIKGKPGNSYLTGVRIRTYNQNISVNYNVVNGTVVGTQENAGSDLISSSIVEYPDGWYRCIMTFRSDASGSQGFQFYVLSGGNNGTLNSSGANGEAMYYWGAQLEAGSNATSFIPTDDTNDGNNGSKTTRGYEYLSMEGSDTSDLYNALEGTLVAEWITTESEGNQNLVSFHKDFASAERIELRATGSNTAKVRFEVVTGSSSTVSDSSISHGGIGDNTKAAFGFKKDDYAASVNGSAVATDTSGNMPSDINSLMIGRSSWGTWFDGYVKRIMYYPKRLPNSQLVTLTA